MKLLKCLRGCRSLIVAGLIAVWFASVIHATASAAEVVITDVQPYHSSARVYFAPVPGAKDYRVYDVATPLDVKYAGLIHLTAAPGCSGVAAFDQASGASCWQRMATNPDGSLVFPYKATDFSYPNGAQGGPTGYDGPAYFIEYNGLGDGQPHTLVVEAVDALGPVPYLNLYKETDIKAYTPMFPGTHDASHMVMLGSNKGPTQDGKTSTNGQGPYTNDPQAIATSNTFVVQADRNYTPIIPGASQVFLDTFEDAEGATLTQQPGDCQSFVDGAGGVGGREWTLNAGTDKASRIIARQIDCTYTMPFIMSNHFMDVLADREATVYGSLSMTPDRTFQLNGGILHLTQEVDDVLFTDRWMDFNIAPASDPLVHWNHQDGALNNANQWLFMMNFGQFGPQNAQLLIANGPAGNPATPGAAANPWSGGVAELYDPSTLAPNGLGFDNKRRWDFFLSATHAALFIDGRLVQQGPLPADKTAWLNGPLKVYFSHYNYHSEAGWKSMLTGNVGYQPGFCNLPSLAYWFNDPENGTQPGAQVTTMVNGVRVPAYGYGANNCNTAYPPGFGYRNTDERHWDNMGASVLPASITAANDFSSLATLVQPPKVQPVGSSTPQPPAPVNCAVSAWGSDTLVSTITNADGSKTQTWQHTRTVTTQPANGGTACPALTETWTVQISAPPSPAQRFEVPYSPVYALRADGTPDPTAVSGVQIPSGTVCGKRLGTTSYYSVQGQKDSSGAVITRDLYTSCVQVQ